MVHPFQYKDRLPEFDKDDALRVVEAFGPMPRAALAAMVDYGLSDDEISRYHSISPETVRSLRLHFNIADDGV